MPPRHGKSWYLGQYLPCWYLGRWPDRRVIYVSYEARQARRYGRLSRNVFNQLDPRLFAQYHGEVLAIDNRSFAANEWNLIGHEGGMETAGIGGPLTGKGAHLLIIDDPIKNAQEAASEVKRETCWEWFHSTAMTRLEPGGSVIVNMTRWHREDLAGRLRAESDRPWGVLSFPAIATESDSLGRVFGEALWPDRYPLHDLRSPDGRLLRRGLETIRNGMPLYWWQALYQQNPTQGIGVEWPPEYFEGDDLWFRDWPRDMPLRVIALDPSKGRTRHSDYSAFILMAWNETGHLWVEADLARRSPGKIVADGVELVRRFKPQALATEGNAWQDLLGAEFVRQLKAAGILDCEGLLVNNSVAKENRIRRLDPWFRQRAVSFRDTPGTRILVDQLKNFPLGLHDDGPDAMEMALRSINFLADRNNNDGGSVTEQIPSL